MHIAIVRADLRKFIHTHGELPRPLISRITGPRSRSRHIHGIIPDRFGPNLDSYVFFPASGLYQVFGEFRHRGKVILTNFTVEVEEPRN